WVEKNNTKTPGYTERVNRQYLPKHFIETGAFLICNSRTIEPNNRIGKVTSVFEIPNNQSIDIDTYQDWWVAEKELAKKNIIICVEGYKEIGLGHVYRALSLAY